jgi:hypothetical protein
MNVDFSTQNVELNHFIKTAKRFYEKGWIWNTLERL